MRGRARGNIRKPNHYNSSLLTFFFSSRSGNTRCSRDWSSDVCSSDLPGHAPLMTELGIGELTFQGATESAPLSVIRGFAEVLPDRVTVLAETAELAAEIDLERAEEIGRASCRERV